MNRMNMRFHHIAAVVKNLDEAVHSLSDVLGLVTPRSGPYSRLIEIDQPNFKLRSKLLQMGDYLLELVEPIEGSRLDILKQHGEGAIYLVSFQVDDIGEAYDAMKEKGIKPQDWQGQPLVNKKYLMVPNTGDKYFFLPKEKTQGLYVELIERGS